MNNSDPMSKLALVIVMMLVAGRNNAQNYPAPNNEPQTCYFVLIQSDNGQPFYVRVNNQIYSSSSEGHLILSQLKDSVYPVTIGLPGQPATERRYLLNIQQRDWVLYLVRQGDTWTLFDKQEQALPSVVDTAAVGRPPLAGVKKDDPFSQMMSAIVQDTAVMYNTYALASDTSQSASQSRSNPQFAGISPDTSSTTLVSSRVTNPAFSGAVRSSGLPSSSGAVRPSGLAPSSGAATGGAASAGSTPFGVTPSSPTGVIKLAERRSTKFLTLIYTDHAADKATDTIDVLIPVESGLLPSRKLRTDTAHSSNKLANHNPRPDTTHSSNKLANNLHADTAQSSRNWSSHNPRPDTVRSAALPVRQNSRPDSANLEATTPRKTRIPFVNSDCHAYATDSDVDKLRIHMLEAAKDDDRIQAAYKTFKTKCFTTKQVRALSEIFTADAAKFKFLATAYPFVSDDNFPDLGNLLSDPVYIEKFRSMTNSH